MTILDVSRSILNKARRMVYRKYLCKYKSGNFLWEKNIQKSGNVELQVTEASVESAPVATKPQNPQLLPSPQSASCQDFH